VVVEALWHSVDHPVLLVVGSVAVSVSRVGVCLYLTHLTLGSTEASVPTPELASPSTPVIEEDESEDEHTELGTVMGSMKYAYDANSEYEISVDGELWSAGEGAYPSRHYCPSRRA
jgi:hypothetical protein